MERKERPFIDCLFFQKEMSFLKASMSKTVCRTETKAVTASSQGLVSVIMRCISTMATSPCMLACCSSDCCICAVSIQRIRLVTVNVSSRGSSPIAAADDSFRATIWSDGHQKSFMKTTGK